jgi:AcrR family transcriptional regulator
MQKHRSSETATSVLRPTTPLDIGQQTQRQRILDAMIESCAEKTFAATTITDIVARAHISRTTFYKQFDDKRACFDAAVDYSIEELGEIADSAIEPDDGPGDASRKAVTAVVDALVARPGLAQLLTGDAFAVDPMITGRYRKATIPPLEALWANRNGESKGHTDPRLAFGQIQVLILHQIASGKPDHLAEVLPELVYLAISPFGGHDEALRQARLARENKATGATR